MNTSESEEYKCQHRPIKIPLSFEKRLQLDDIAQLRKRHDRLIADANSEESQKNALNGLINLRKQFEEFTMDRKSTSPASLQKTSTNLDCLQFHPCVSSTPMKSRLSTEFDKEDQNNISEELSDIALDSYYKFIEQFGHTDQSEVDILNRKLTNIDCLDDTISDHQLETSKTNTDSA